jgi:hypothetical protein
LITSKFFEIINWMVSIFDLQGLTQKNYDDIVAELKANGGFPHEHRLSHAAFQKGDGWCVIDVWDSVEDLMEFGQNRLFPIFGKLGLTASQPQIYPVHHFIGANAEEFISG